MGNRAVIQPEGKNIGVYLHWNGGRDSVEAFLKYCELRGFREFEDDYGMARFVQVVANFFGGSLSIGIVPSVTEEDIDWLDNGVYIVKGWKIVGRKVWKGFGDEPTEYDVKEFLREIDKCQPESDRLGDDYFKSVPTKTFEIDEEYLIREYEGSSYTKVKCICEDGRYGYMSKYGWFIPFSKGMNVRKVIL